MLEQNKDFDYISILTGGKCGFKCSFCIGNGIREENEKAPHISEKWSQFLRIFSTSTNTLSISGSTSDPCFLDMDLHRDIVNVAKYYNPNIKTSLHTRSKGIFVRDIFDLYDEVVISVETLKDMKLLTHLKTYKLFYSGKDLSKFRISVVLTKEN